MNNVVSQGNKLCLLRGDPVKWNCGAVTSLGGEGSRRIVLLDLNQLRFVSECCRGLYALHHVSENGEQSAFPSLGVSFFFWRTSVFCQNFGTSCSVAHKHA